MPLFIAGTGTDVGKTILSALVMAKYAVKMGLRYLKPVQTGADSDRATVAQLTRLGDSHFLPELYRFDLAASPHYAARCEEQEIDFHALVKNLSAHAEQRVVVELAGGLLVPLANKLTNLDLISAVGFPAVLVADTGLGTINHTLLSWNAMQTAGIACRGIFFVGRENPLKADNIHTILEISGATLIGEFLLPESALSAGDFAARAQYFDPDGIMRDILT
jgi:dethiobiotin synthetase